MANIIEELEKEQTQGKEIAEFAPGDTVIVNVKVKRRYPRTYPSL